MTKNFTVAQITRKPTPRKTKAKQKFEDSFAGILLTFAAVIGFGYVMCLCSAIV